jgi:tetratricopeptide (TPR) repeat protein/tRNA A-37 threonylcarbamoyl transferase component Bud32
MDAERWREIEAVFQAARDRDPLSRQTFLNEACRSDPSLRAEVEALLAADSVGSGFLEPTVVASSGPELAGRLQVSLGSAYLIERELGGGGMSRVFVAHETALSRRVVVKLLPPELAAELDAERFRREIRLAASLQHPHVVPVHASSQAGELLYYIMPYVEGESLKHRLEREGPLPIGEVVRLLREITDALCYAHRRGIIHRDLKPANILLEEGHALVTDFGIAKALFAATGEADQPVALTSTGLVLGTPVYMAPEQAAGDQIDHRADLYALGCLAYELLTGRPPFTGGSAQALIAAHFADTPKPLEQHRQGLPPKLMGLVLRLLAKMPAERPQSAQEVLRDLETLSIPARSVPLIGVVGIYLACSLVMLGLAYLSMVQLGLPDWLVPSAVVLLLIGFPIIVATALVQGWPVTSAADGLRAGEQRAKHWLTWRRAISGGVFVFSALGFVVTTYMAMRAFGIGPVGTLLAAGVLKEREPVLLADFENHTRDSLLGDVITDAFRIDLAQSQLVSLVPPEQVAAALERMRRPGTSRIDGALAREIAVREGIKAVVTGEVASAGPQVVLAAQLISPRTGEVLAGQRATARDSTEIMQAVDQVSRKLRERVGESLKALRGESSLEQVTTSSLPALRKYSQALSHRAEGDDDRAIDLLEEAVALDTSFAMAYRMLGTILSGLGTQGAQTVEAVTRAYQHRDRLTERERYITIGTYYTFLGEPEKSMAAYQALLESDPYDRHALNNLGHTYNGLQQYARAESLFRRLVSRDSTDPFAVRNLVTSLEGLSKSHEAERVLQNALRRFPHNVWIGYEAALLPSSTGDYVSARARLLALEEEHGENLFWRAVIRKRLAQLASVRGKLVEAERHLQEAMSVAMEDGDTAHYVELSLHLAALDIEIRHAPLRGLQRVEATFRLFPFDSMTPLDRPHFQLAEIYATAGRPDRARLVLADYEMVTDPVFRRGEERERYSILGEIARAEGRLREAVSEFRLASARSTPTVCAICPFKRLGTAYDEAHAPDSAAASYERYVTTPSVDRIWYDGRWLPSVLVRLGELYEAQGEQGKARHYYKRFVDLWKDCDPELQPQVAKARRRIQALEG